MFRCWVEYLQQHERMGSKRWKTDRQTDRQTDRDRDRETEAERY